MESKSCFRDICIEENYTVQFDPDNLESDRYIRAGFYLTDIKEVDTDHHHVTFDVGLIMRWRDMRITCKNQVSVTNMPIFIVLSLQVSRCSVPLTILPEIWKPIPLTYRLKNQKDGALQLLELSRNATKNVIAKTTSDITLSCPMDFSKFPFDQQSCKFEMILDEVLNGNLTIQTGAVMFTAQIVQQKFEPSEFSYDYKVQELSF